MSTPPNGPSGYFPLSPNDRAAGDHASRWLAHVRAGRIGSGDPSAGASGEWRMESLAAILERARGVGR